MKPAVLQRQGAVAFWRLRAWERFGVRAYFFLRTGGYSRGAYGTLNLGFTTGDLPARVQQNREAARRAAGLGPWAPVLGQQVHGNRLRVVSLREQGRGWQDAARALPGTDGLLTAEPGLPLGVASADCLPVLLASAGPARVVAAIHVGWRGLVSDILPLAVHRLARQWKIEPGHLFAALGPAIGPKAFLVRGEVLEQLRSLYPEAVSVSERFSPVAGFDLWRAAQSQLQNAGVPGQNVTLIRECTASHPKRYFSHRRDQGETGRMLAMVQIEDPFPQPAHLPGKRPILCKKRGNHGNQ